MALTKYKLGDLIEQTFETNLAGKYLASDVKGMTITKEIIPTKADVSNTDLSKFIVVNPNEFIYNPRTHGKKIGLAYNDTQKSFIISWNNVAFRVKESMKNVVIPQYLFLHFNRDEWDRQACFCSWGSSTEVFTWSEMCDIEITLPPLDVQEKFVAVYNSLIENRKVYERGLDDLKLVCDGYIENLRRNLPCEKISNYIELSDERNVDNFYTADDVRGIGTTKELISTKADLDGVSLKNYKIVKPEQFAYVADTSRRGDKISIALNEKNSSVIVSSISTVFNTSKEKLLPEYLMLFFNRAEFDRYARFHSWGSAREVFTWKDLCEVEVPIPSLEIQKSIAAIYDVYRTRQKVLERLKLQIKKICPILIKGSLDEGAKS